MARRQRVEDLAEGLLAGQRLALARAISQVENGNEQARSILQRIFPRTGQAHIVGVTGAPGTGKSTLVTALTQGYREKGMTVAVLAVDPTSPFTGGALLGDRVRMAKLSGDQGVFIRSMATRGSLGGLSKTSSDVLMLLDAAGFDRIIVETVGVGQAEVAIASTAHTTIVVEAPGLGDEVQAIKAGILEIADIFVVNKSDRPGAQRTVTALEMMLHLGNGGARPLGHHGRLMAVETSAESSSEQWPLAVLKTVATTGKGADALQTAIEDHRRWLLASGEMAERERLRTAYTLENLIQTELYRRLRTAIPEHALNELVDAVSARRLDPYAAVEELLQRLPR